MSETLPARSHGGARAPSMWSCPYCSQKFRSANSVRHHVMGIRRYLTSHGAAEERIRVVKPPRAPQ